MTNADPTIIITGLVLLAFLTERVTEIILKAFPILDRISTKSFCVPMILSFVVGTTISVMLNITLLSLFPVTAVASWATIGGFILTGVILMGGSGIMHDIIEWVTAGKISAKEA